ncbi:MAG: serine/threonine protein kinase [Myxococcales bacterium]|nr:serine/threonine protein kinase [Myxococcales bacterium]
MIGGRYRVLRLVGRGGMGAVYVCEHVNTGGTWALKILLGAAHLDAAHVERFRREARASAKISSDNVVRVTDADVAPELNGAPFMVMELLHGEDLGARLERGGALPPADALEILKQVARALDKAHAAGIVHRDLKPENIYLHRPEQGPEVVKLVDFGISKILGGDDKGGGLAVTRSNSVMGTPLYMAPEQASSRHDEISPATDTWALALITLQMLTGEIYWTETSSVLELLMQIMSDARPAPSARWPWLGPELDRWFAKSTSPAPADRFASAGEQIAELSVVLTGARWSAPTPSSGSERPRSDPAVASARADGRDANAVSSAGALSISSKGAAPDPVVAERRPGRALYAGGAVLALAVIAGGGVFAVRRSSDTSPAPGSAATTVSASVPPPATAASAPPAPSASTAPSASSAPSASTAPSSVIAATASVAVASSSSAPSAPRASAAPKATTKPPASAAATATTAPAPPPDLFDKQR